MDLALISLRQILVMLVIMTIGIICAKTKLIDEEANKKLSSFVLLLVGPLVIFLSYHRPFEEELLQGLLISLVLAVISFGISITITHLVYRKKDGQDFAVEKFASVYSNSGFIGIPLVYGIFQSEGVFYLTAYLTMFNLLVWTHGVMVMSGKRSLESVKKTFGSPPIIAVFSGFIIFILGIEIPWFIEQPLQMVGGMNTPLAMIVAGVSISQSKIGKILKDVRIYKVCFMRLILIPGIILFIFSFFDVADVLVATSIVAVACPVAASVIMFAYRYEKDYLYAAEIFSLTTILSLVTIPVLLLFI